MIKVIAKMPFLLLLQRVSIQGPDGFNSLLGGAGRKDRWMELAHFHGNKKEMSRALSRHLPPFVASLF